TKPDVVIAVSIVAILAAKEASSTVPIVMSFIGEDPLEKGVANSFARPGGNVTGVAMLAAEMDGKRASLLHDFVPAARRIAILTGRRLAMRRAPRRLDAWLKRLGSRPMCFTPMNRQTLSRRSPVCARPAPRHWSSSLRRISFVTPRCK